MHVFTKRVFPVPVFAMRAFPVHVFARRAFFLYTTGDVSCEILKGLHAVYKMFENSVV